MMRKFARFSALTVVVVMGVLIATGSWSRVEKALAAGWDQHEQTAPGGRKVLYWYDAMNPQQRYDKPGKAPNGMDLVPKYADESSSVPGRSQTPAGSLHAEHGPSSQPAGQRKVLYWYDAMNPQHRYDKPGKAPDGMDLVPKYADGGADMTKMALGTVKVSAERQQLIGVRTGTVERQPVFRDIRAVAQLTANETMLAHVHVKVNGWVEKVFVDFVGQLVKQGQPLFTLYSPDLVATQEEYLIARRGDQYLGKSSFAPAAEGARSLLRSTKERLKLWDISEDQIERLDKTGEVSKYMTFYSPVTGFVLDRKAFPQTSVTPDTELYTIADLSTIWADAQIYEYEVPYVHLGQSAEMELSYFPGKTYKGKISYIYPTVDAVTRTVRVRLQFPNPKFDLKPQMFAEVHLKINYGNHIVVPESAVLDSGERQTVFIAHNGGYFEPREVTIGPRVGDEVIVLAGLKQGETIATSGTFLIDSESRLTSAMGGMQH